MKAKEALDLANSLANFVSAAYNIHLAIVTAILGLITAAFRVPEFNLDLQTKVALGVFYLIVASTTLVTLVFLYRKINALNVLSNILLNEELETYRKNPKYVELNGIIPVITKPITGYIHKFLFPMIIILVLSGIVLAPSGQQKSRSASSGNSLLHLVHAEILPAG